MLEPSSIKTGCFSWPGWFIPSGPRTLPYADLQGEQGSAKTTLARIPKIIVDPDRSSQEHEFLFLRQIGYRHRGRVVDTTALQEGPRRRETRAGKQLEALAH